MNFQGPRHRVGNFRQRRSHGLRGLSGGQALFMQEMLDAVIAMSPQTRCICGITRSTRKEAWSNDKSTIVPTASSWRHTRGVNCRP